MKCPLCGYQYDKDRLACHAACPLAGGCAIICCPNCGYQMVDESKSGLAKLLRHFWRPAEFDSKKVGENKNGRNT